MDDFKQQADLNKKYKEEARKKFLDDSNNRLHTICERKARTSFIGALSQFEIFFGFLWGHIPYEHLTEEQVKIAEALEEGGISITFFKNLWEKCREKILTNGNNQIRALDEEFSHYKIEWNRYNVVLPVKSPYKQDNKEE